MSPDPRRWSVRAPTTRRRDAGGGILTVSATVRILVSRTSARRETGLRGATELTHNVQVDVRRLRATLDRPFGRTSIASVRVYQLVGVSG